MTDVERKELEAQKNDLIRSVFEGYCNSQEDCVVCQFYNGKHGYACDMCNLADSRKCIPIDSNWDMQDALEQCIKKND